MALTVAARITARASVAERRNPFHTDRPITAALHGWPRSVLDHPPGRYAANARNPTPSTTSMPTPPLTLAGPNALPSSPEPVRGWPSGCVGRGQQRQPVRPRFWLDYAARRYRCL